MTVTEIVVQTQPSALEWIAGIATAASAVVIAVQAWMTRKSVEASDEAVEVAQAALTESQLSRIESGFPRITVSVRPFFDDTTVWRILSSGAEPVREDDVFKLPRDASVRLRLDHTFLVRNDGPGTVVPKIRTSTGAMSWDRSEPIPPGESKQFSFELTHTVERWVELLATETGANGRVIRPVCATIWVEYSGPRDSDVDETHPIIVRGSALIAVDDAQGDWRRANESDFGSSLSASEAPATRTYWRSRSAGVKFEQPSV